MSGGARGIGRAIAKGLAERGARLVVNFAHSVEPAERTVAEIEESGGTAVTARGDVTTADGAQAVVDVARDHFGDVDVLVNNAAGPQPSAPVEDAGWDHHLDQLRFTVAAPVQLGRAVLSGCGNEVEAAS